MRRPKRNRKLGGNASRCSASMTALQLLLPGCISWARPRTYRGRVRYPEQYERDRQAWAIVVRAAVQAQGWQYPEGARFGVHVKTVNGGKRDLDRCVTAVLDALQAGGAISDDAVVDRIQAIRERRRHVGAWTEVQLAVLA